MRLKVIVAVNVDMRSCSLLDILTQVSEKFDASIFGEKV
jgi:hypothetical protein